MSADLTSRVKRLPLWAAVIFCSGALAVTWWISSLSVQDGPDHLIGPFYVPLLVEWSVGAALVGLAVLAAFVVHRPHAITTVAGDLSWTATGWLITASVLISACWRVLTDGVVGANIGAGLVLTAGPVAVALLLQGSLLAERHARGGRLHHVLVVSAVVWAAALCASVALWYSPLGTS